MVAGVVAPVLHRNENPPDATSMCESPGQIVTGGQMTQLGAGPGDTVTVVVHVLLQLPVDTVTV